MMGQQSFQRKVALVIGNGAYEHANPLQSPTRDAVAMEKCLQEIGFEVLRPAIDSDIKGMRVKISDFLSRLNEETLGLFYFSGHGVSVLDNTNYLLPVNAEIAAPDDIIRFGFSVDKILADMQQRAKISLVFLDACRDNPFKDMSEGAGDKGVVVARTGLSAVKAGNPGQALIAFSADEGAVSKDGGDRPNSPFTEALLEHLRLQGASINEVLQKVRKSVLELTDHRQRPWTNDALTENLVLVPSIDDAERGKIPDDKPEPPAPNPLKEQTLLQQVIAATTKEKLMVLSVDIESALQEDSSNKDAIAARNVHQKKLDSYNQDVCSPFSTKADHSRVTVWWARIVTDFRTFTVASVAGLSLAVSSYFYPDFVPSSVDKIIEKLQSISSKEKIPSFDGSTEIGLQMLELAKSELAKGIHELRNPGRVGDYWRSIGFSYDGNDDKNPWSAAFVSWLFIETKNPLDIETSAKNYRFLKSAVEKNLARFPGEYSPKPGDLIIQTRGNERNPIQEYKKGKTHPFNSSVGIILSVKDGLITVIGGNVNNSVSTWEIKTKDDRIVGFVRLQANDSVPHMPLNKFRVFVHLPASIQTPALTRNLRSLLQNLGASKVGFDNQTDKFGPGVDYKMNSTKARLAAERVINEIGEASSFNTAVDIGNARPQISIPSDNILGIWLAEKQTSDSTWTTDEMGIGKSRYEELLINLEHENPRSVRDDARKELGKGELGLLKLLFEELGEQPINAGRQYRRDIGLLIAINAILDNQTHQILDTHIPKYAEQKLAKLTNKYSQDKQILDQIDGVKKKLQ